MDEHIKNIRPVLSRKGTKNLPSNSFMNWLRDRIDNGNINIDFNYIDSKDCKWLSDALKNKINLWNHLTPVFISAQTGTGKNTFIRENLLLRAYQSGERILLLSNRIALNRQSKLQYAQYIRDLTGNSYYVEKFDEYTNKGIDKFSDFGFITICSYHQFYDKHLLDNNEYSYIVCDECHFFTSDATFNIYTDKILEYIVMSGKNSIRIYMTATIENVFEPIIRLETQWIEDEIRNLEEQANFQRDCKMDIINRVNMQLDFQYGRNEFWYHNPDDAISRQLEDIDRNLQESTSNIKMKCFFYYMSRNYDYVENVYTYKNHGELLEVINASEDKWLIFVFRLPSQDKEDALNNISRKVVELSREKVNNNNSVAYEVYNRIIEREYFNEDVLITTSLLDNGININDEKLKNIVIDVFDRTEFIQMLGRVRIKGNRKINLYIREYTIEELEKFLQYNVTILVLMLYIDLLNKEGRKQFYDNLLHSSEYSHCVREPIKFFRLSDDMVIEYNKNAILKLIDSSNCIFNLIRKSDANYILRINEHDQNLLIKVRDYYVSGEGQNKSWSRSVVDLIETKFGFDDRKKFIREEVSWDFERASIIEDKYSFKFNDDFIHYLYSTLIPNYFNSLINMRIGKIKNVESWRYYKMNFDSRATSKDSSPIEILRVIKEVMRFDNAIDISKEEYYNNLMFYYLRLLDITVTGSLDEQLSWIEKCNYISIPVTELICSRVNDNNSSYEDSIQEDIIKKIISEQVYKEHTEEYRNNIVKSTDDFLIDYGIKRNSAEEKWIRENYCKNVGKSTLKDFEFHLDGTLVRVQAVQSKRNNCTYYLLVRE